MLSFEQLETRSLLSCVVSGSISTVITGDSSDNTIDVSNDGSGNLRIECDGVVFDRSSVTSLTIRSGAGDDILDVYLDADLVVAMRLAINGGAGNDEISVDYSGYGSLVLVADFSANILGSNGDDDIFVAVGQVDAKVAVSANAGNGVDYFEAHLDGDVSSGSTVSVRSNMGTGDDEAWINTSLIVFDFGSKITIGLDGGSGNDILIVDQVGQIDGKTSVTINGSTGNDIVSFTGLVTADSSTENALTIVIKGASGNDTMVASIVDEALVGFRASVDGGQGIDSGWVGNFDTYDPSEFSAVRSLESQLSDWFIW